MSNATKTIRSDTWGYFLPKMISELLVFTLISCVILAPIYYFDLNIYFWVIGVSVTLLVARNVIRIIYRRFLLSRLEACLGFNWFFFNDSASQLDNEADFYTYREVFKNIEDGLNKVNIAEYTNSRYLKSLSTAIELRLSRINPQYRWDLIDEFMSHNFNISPIYLITPLIETLSFEDLDKISQKVLINKSNEELVDYVAQMIRLLNESKNPKKDELINHTLTIFNKSIPNFIELLKVCDAISIDKELNKMLSLKLELNLKKDDSNYHGKVSKI